MIHAELKGKDSIQSRMSDMEDVLTSNVFGVLGTIEPEVLRSFLEEALGTPSVKGPFQLQFWPRQFIGISEWWACEPDVIITGQGMVVFVEAKLGAEFGKGADYQFEGNQLPREHKALTEYSLQTSVDKYSNYLDSGAPFSIVGGFLDRDFLARYLVNGKASAKPYWDYQKIFKECRPESGELKNGRKGVRTPVECISIFSPKSEIEAFIRLVAGKFQESAPPKAY